MDSKNMFSIIIFSTMSIILLFKKGILPVKVSLSDEMLAELSTWNSSSKKEILMNYYETNFNFQDIIILNDRPIFTFIRESIII